MKKLLYCAILFLTAHAAVSAQGTEINKDKKIKARDIRHLPDHVLYVVNGKSMDVHKRTVFKHIKLRDIKTITFITDPAANAVYGARGANGVVLVVTDKQENMHNKG